MKEGGNPGRIHQTKRRYNVAAVGTNEELLAEEKRLRQEIEMKYGKTPEQLYDERAG